MRCPTDSCAEPAEGWTAGILWYIDKQILVWPPAMQNQPAGVFALLLRSLDSSSTLCCQSLRTVADKGTAATMVVLANAWHRRSCPGRACACLSRFVGNESIAAHGRAAGTGRSVQSSCRTVCTDHQTVVSLQYHRRSVSHSRSVLWQLEQIVMNCWPATRTGKIEGRYRCESCSISSC